jgi:hypothetical protein
MFVWIADSDTSSLAILLPCAIVVYQTISRNTEAGTPEASVFGGDVSRTVRHNSLLATLPVQLNGCEIKYCA